VPPEQSLQTPPIATQLQIRPPEPNEAGEVAGLLQEVYAWTYYTAIPPAVLARFLSTELSKPAIAADLRRPGVHYHAAFRDGRAVGVSKLEAGAPPGRTATEGWVELAKCYVNPAYHGQGIAGRLLNAACEAAHFEGFRQIWLCVWEHNPRAIAFYRKYGFSADGMMPIYVEDIRFDDLVMRRGLDDR
jgi:ribosomal protein S18 acetylase RimI-like enzyme